MGIWLDSASVEEAQICAALGFVAGITTNPALVQATGLSSLEAIRRLLDVFDGPVCAQLVREPVHAAEDEARMLAALAPGRVIIKIPASLDRIALGARLAPAIPWALTATFSAAQVALAGAAGARYVIPYVNRMTRLGSNGIDITRAMARICGAAGGTTEVLAASIKSPDEAVQALLAGASHVSVPFAVLRDMAEHQLSASAVADFARVAATVGA